MPAESFKALDLKRLRVHPLAQRKSLSRLEDILIDPDSAAPPCAEAVSRAVEACAEAIQAARRRDAGVMLLYGAHLLRNGAARIIERLIEGRWLAHLATNGAGTIHDWEYAYLGRSTENVAENVAAGTFGAWDETGRAIHVALLAGALQGQGYGAALGGFILEDGVELPAVRKLESAIGSQPRDPLTAARAELLQALIQFELPPGYYRMEHRWKQASILAQAFRHRLPLTVHPGIGYDIISNHPMFNGAAIGRAAEVDFKRFGATVDGLDGGVVLSIGSAIMAPQVFEKSLSCVNNLRLQAGRPAVAGHQIYVVDLQDGGNWDWSRGEPPTNHPAYYLRFCKSFSRMGGRMTYLQCDNVLFLRHLYDRLRKLAAAAPFPQDSPSQPAL